MTRRLRTAVVALLAAAMVLAGVGSAFAVQADEADEGTDGGFETLKAKTIDRLELRIAGLEEVIEGYEGESGPRARQAVALAEEGIAAYRAAITEVEGAETVREVVEAFGSARREVRTHSRVRRFYAHVQQDIDKFGRRLGFLETAIERADEAGADVAAASAEARAAAADLEYARRLLDGIDPGQSGSEIVETLKEAHRSAHSAQKHIRAGWRELLEALPPPDAEAAPE